MTDILQIKKNYIYISRAATGLWLVFKERLRAGDKVLFPANICYAAVYPILYAGGIPTFCDVDRKSGNVAYDLVYQYKDQVNAMVIPHMYGNPVEDIDRIYNLCQENNILLIEDCASAMGASVNGKPCGSWGEYVLYSTGYSKTIDVGRGGILCSDFDLKKINENYKKLPLQTQQNVWDENFFSKLYRLIRNNPQQDISQHIWKGLINEMWNVFVNYDPDIPMLLTGKLGGLEHIIETRRKRYKLYESLLHDCPAINVYQMGCGAVPWRFCILVSLEAKTGIVEYLLKKHVPVSDWYPVVGPIFGNCQKYENAEWMERRILNFPLLIDEDEISRICDSVKECCK